jgi:hypothetical protein
MRTRKLAWLALLVVALSVTVALLYVSRAVVENRTYVIGWEVDPPDQVATETDEPTGFAVELVREAARRRGIRLKWVQHPESSEAALRSKAVDLWPMMVITEDRKKILHLTEPYQENEFGLFVDANSAFMTPGDLKQQTISYDGLPFNGRLLGEHSLEVFIYGRPHWRKRSDPFAMVTRRRSSKITTRCSHSCCATRLAPAHRCVCFRRLRSESNWALARHENQALLLTRSVKRSVPWQATEV